jgi:hypothetical protein
LSLFDHLIGAAKQRKRYGNAEGLGGFQIDDQIDLSDLLNRKISRLLPLENSANVFSEYTIRFRVIGSVTHETAGHWKLAVRINGWHCVLGCQIDKPITLGQEEILTTDHQRAHSFAAIRDILGRSISFLGKGIGETV